MQSAEMKKATVHDIEVAYKTWGEGEPLLMLMGLSGTLDLWEPRVLERLSSEYKVVAFDFRGMGETTAGTNEFTIGQFAEDTVGLMEALGIERAHAA